MACTNCSGASQLQPARSNGGLYILHYIGAAVSLTLLGEVTGTIYNFGTKKKDFWVDFRDLPGLFQSEYGTDLRSEVQ